MTRISSTLDFYTVPHAGKGLDYELDAQWLVTRQSNCCKKPLKRGEAVLVFTARHPEELPREYIFHGRCLSKALKKMPNDDTDITRQFEALRAAMREQGTVFPEVVASGLRSGSI